jgi:hypothetical protein
VRNEKSGNRVQDLRVQGLGFRDYDAGFRFGVQGQGPRVQGQGPRVWSLRDMTTDYFTALFTVFEASRSSLYRFFLTDSPTKHSENG